MKTIDFNSVDQELKSLGWGWDHSRIVAYIYHLNSITNKRYSAATLPLKHYMRLYKFLRRFKQINGYLKTTSLGWNEPVVKSFFEKYSWVDTANQKTNRLKLEDWQHLETLVVQYYVPF